MLSLGTTDIQGQTVSTISLQDRSATAGIDFVHYAPRPRWCEIGPTVVGSATNEGLSLVFEEEKEYWKSGDRLLTMEEFANHSNEIDILLVDYQLGYQIDDPQGKQVDGLTLINDYTAIAMAIPLLSDEQKVKIGGGEKHRMTLNEMIMIKDNHLAVGNSIEGILEKAKKTGGKIEIEVETQKDAILCAKLGADIIMLDNFSPDRIKKTIKKLTELRLRNKIILEASGRINSKNIAKYAKTNVDMISVGSVTNSVEGIDLSLEIS